MLERKKQEKEDGERQRSASHRAVGDVCPGRDPVEVGECVLQYLRSPGRGKGKQKALRGKQAWYFGGSVCLGRSAEVGSGGKFLSVSEVTDTASI